MKKNNFEQSKGKLMNNFAAAYNEPSINFPDSDTLGGAAVLKSNTGFTMQVKEPIYDTIPNIKDPIISEVSIVPLSNGGGIVPGMIGVSELNPNMNPTEPAPNQPVQTVDPAATNTTTESKPKSKFVLFLIIILVIIGVIYLMKKK